MLVSNNYLLGCAFVASLLDKYRYYDVSNQVFLSKNILNDAKVYKECQKMLK